MHCSLSSSPLQLIEQMTGPLTSPKRNWYKSNSLSELSESASWPWLPCFASVFIQPHQLWPRRQFVQRSTAAGSFPASSEPEDGSTVQLSEGGCRSHSPAAAPHEQESTEAVNVRQRRNKGVCSGDSSQDWAEYWEGFTFPPETAIESKAATAQHLWCKAPL